jgi:hypothetical protein
MMNPFKDVSWNPTPAEKRKFALSLIIGFPAIAIFFGVVNRISTHAWRPFFLWLGIIGASVGIILWLIPQIARPFYVVWYFVACCVGFIVGNVIFGLIFYGLFTPFGLLRRLLAPNAFSKGFDRSKTSYWQPVEKVVDVKRYYRQF